MNEVWYYPKEDQLLHWEWAVGEAKGICWAGLFSEDRVAGTPLSLEQFEDRIDDLNLVYIGEF